MLIFVVTQSVPLVLLLAQVGMLYLTWLDLRDEPGRDDVKLWWGLLVLLLGVPGYVAMRIWLLVRHRRAGRRPA